MNVVYWSGWSVFILFFPFLVLFIARDATRVFWEIEDAVVLEIDERANGTTELPLSRQLTPGREKTDRYRIVRAADGRLVKVLDDVPGEQTTAN